MWNYEKRLQYPVNITRPNAEMAKVIISQFGGPDGEVGAAMRYLSQRYSNTNRKVAGVLTDIGVSVVKLRMKIVPGNGGEGRKFLCFHKVVTVLFIPPYLSFVTSHALTA